MILLPGKEKLVTEMYYWYCFNFFVIFKVERVGSYWAKLLIFILQCQCSLSFFFFSPLQMHMYSRVDRARLQWRYKRMWIWTMLEWSHLFWIREAGAVCLHLSSILYWWLLPPALQSLWAALQSMYKQFHLLGTSGWKSNVHL